MALLNADIQIIQAFAAIHPFLIEKIEANAYSEIATWLLDTPQSPDVAFLAGYISTVDRENFFSYQNFPIWYSELNKMIRLNTYQPINGMTLSQTKVIVRDLLAEIMRLGLIDETLQGLSFQLLDRNLYDVSAKLLLCFGFSKVFEVNTIWIYSVEFMNYPRWVSLGLSTFATENEIQQIFG